MTINELKKVKGDNEAKIELISKSQNEKFSRNVVALFLLELNPSVEELNDIKTAVSEAVTNSVVHGYKGSEGRIVITLKLKDNSLYIKVEDFGVGISDIERARQPFFSTGPEDERSGMGFTVMETFMDEVNVVNQETGTGLIVEMAKNLKTSEK